MVRQQTLFGDVEKPAIRIDDAAQQAGVSTATIRNWIKTGYLKQEQRGFVSKESFCRFLKEVAGFDKLNSRANKSCKDSHDHERISLEVLEKISGHEGMAEFLGNEYEMSLSESYRNKEGIYYTPLSIVEDLFRSHLTAVSSKTFCDPCCGSGNFIMRALELGFKPENVYGYDTDPVAVAITKARIFKKTGYRSENILEGDFLKLVSEKKDIRFDRIYTNPPWGKKLPKHEKEFYASLFRAGKSLDTCSLFLFACLSCLEKGGELGLLLPESFFNIATFESARVKCLSLSINRLIDYGKPFKGLLTKAQAIVLTNRESSSSFGTITCESNGTSCTRSASSFVRNPKAILNFHCNANDSAVIEHVFSLPHITLEGQAKWGLGIVTGNNKKFCKNNPAIGYMPVYTGSDIRKSSLKTPHCFIPSDLSLYQQVAPVELYEAREKLIYKFISNKLCFYCDTEHRYILNSANMLIPEDGLSISGKQLCALLNSEFINWLFKSVFNTHKILRGDLELLPIHLGYFAGNFGFDEEKYLDFLGIERVDDGAYRIK